jgi:glycosyltransferase involved in cell wall biosynthesis
MIESVIGMFGHKFLVSVIISNYNYADFVGAAINSALDLDWPLIEVIVVDDGSTDKSREVIARFADRVTVIFQRNCGQTSACNAGFARSRGEVVFFLDSDDLLHSSIVRELANVWRSGLSKVQFQMRTIDAEGTPTGSVLPQYHIVPSPDQVRRWVTTAAAYPTPPASGNAYSRSFLEQIFPLDPFLDRFCDTHCLSAAPFLGDVVTIPKPLVSYRIHGRNDGAMRALDINRCVIEVQRALRRFSFSQKIARTVGIDLVDDTIRRSMSLLPYRLASCRLAPKQHPFEGDTKARLLVDAMRGAMTPQGLTLRARLALVVWAFLVALVPLSVAKNLIQWRFVPTMRPKALKSALSVLKITRHQEGREA